MNGRPPRRHLRPRPGRAAKPIAAFLLLMPFVALLWVSSYAKTEPRLLGFPFFFWYQLLWVFLSSAMTGCAYLLLSPRRRSR
jgi:hypothetical protein